LCGIFIRRTSDNPDLRATYGTVANLITFSASVRLPDVGRHLGER
jgi:hypothetical protein